MSLSHPEVIARLNRYFVPVFLSNEDYREGGAASPEEKAELRRIHKEGYDKKLSVGTVHAFVLGSDGHLLDSLHTVDVAKPDRLVSMLDRSVQSSGTRGDAPVVTPVPPAVPKADPDSLLLHLTARYLERKGEEYALVEHAGGNWSALPSEDWITLRSDEWRKLLPAGAVRVGQEWEIDRSVSTALLVHFYPPTENSDITTNRIEEQSLLATVTSVEKGIATAKLEGRLRMKHHFYHKDDDRFVEASFIGFISFDPSQRCIMSLQIVTERGEYRGGGSVLSYGVAVRTVHAPEVQ